MCESEVVLVFLFLFFLLTIVIRVWIGQTQLKETEKDPRFLFSGLLNSLVFTEKVIQRPLECGSSFPSCLMVKYPLNCPLLKRKIQALNVTVA